MREIEVRQLGAQHSRTAEHGKDCEVTAAANRLVAIGRGKESFDSAGVDRLARPMAIPADSGKIGGSAEVLVGHLSQPPRLAQHTPQRRKGGVRGCWRVAGGQYLGKSKGSAVVEPRPRKGPCPHGSPWQLHRAAEQLAHSE